MSDLIFSLPHYRRYSDLRSVDNIHEFTPYVSFTGFAFYIVVRCGFDNHIYLTSFLNAHNHAFAQNRLYYAKNGSLHY